MSMMPTTTKVSSEIVRVRLAARIVDAAREDAAA
jgi:hypothetical protein